MEQTNDTCEPSIVVTNEIVTNTIQGEDMKGTHPVIREAYKLSDSTEDGTDRVNNEIKIARIEHYNYSDKVQNEGV